MSIEKCMDASIYYLAENDFALANPEICHPYKYSKIADNPINAYYNKNSGFTVYCGTFINRAEDPDFHYLDMIRSYGYSEAFITMMRYAAERGCSFLHISFDGDDEIEDIPLTLCVWDE